MNNPNEQNQECHLCCCQHDMFIIVFWKGTFKEVSKKREKTQKKQKSVIGSLRTNSSNIGDFFSLNTQNWQKIGFLSVVCFFLRIQIWTTDCCDSKAQLQHNPLSLLKLLEQGTSPPSWFSSLPLIAIEKPVNMTQDKVSFTLNLSNFPQVVLEVSLIPQLVLHAAIIFFWPRKALWHTIDVHWKSEQLTQVKGKKRMHWYLTTFSRLSLQLEEWLNRAQNENLLTKFNTQNKLKTSSRQMLSNICFVELGRLQSCGCEPISFVLSFGEQLFHPSFCVFVSDVCFCFWKQCLFWVLNPIFVFVFGFWQCLFDFWLFRITHRFCWFRTISALFWTQLISCGPSFFAKSVFTKGHDFLQNIKAKLIEQNFRLLVLICTNSQQKHSEPSKRMHRQLNFVFVCFWYDVSLRLVWASGWWSKMKNTHATNSRKSHQTFHRTGLFWRSNQCCILLIQLLWR